MKHQSLTAADQTRWVIGLRYRVLFFFLLFVPVMLWAQGRIIIPEILPETGTGHVYLKEVRGEVTIKDGAADVSLEQIFQNTSKRQLEGEYLFALPHEAQIYDFYLYINGKKTKGELLDSRRAATVYENIVRQIKDPALLEYTGHGLFKARIFPIEANKSRKIELSYAQLLRQDENMTRFVLPIRQSGQGQIERYDLTINLESKRAISTIYSPSHEIEISREGNSGATIKLQVNNMEGDKDFILYYARSQKEVDASILTFRPRTDRDGFFMLMALPGQNITAKVLPKDVIFVIDVSGSMQGEKIDQAKDALKYCVGALNSEDRFEIISFSSDVRMFQGDLQNADDDPKGNARYFINSLSASGGTNINEALLRALKLKNEEDHRLTSIVFLTDGLPTEGEQNIARIIQNVKRAKKSFINVFTFGVGYDVNTFLLDKLAQESGGSSNYVKPGEHIEREVSRFFAKITEPVMTSPELDFGGLRVYDVYPKELPDLFKGERAVIFGRYQKPGEGKVTLSGKQGKNRKSYSYEIEMPRRQTNNDFIANLWANRKVSDMLMKLRFEGENAELVESIKALALEYGIVTPYTSYLVTEQRIELADLAGQEGAGQGIARVLERQSARDQSAQEDEEAFGGEAFFQSIAAAPKPEAASTGKSAVMASRAMKKFSTQEQDRDMLVIIKKVQDKTFKLNGGIWMEQDLKDDEVKIIKIKFLSDDYFKLMKKYPKLNRILALGEQMKFSWENKIYQIEK